MSHTLMFTLLLLTPLLVSALCFACRLSGNAARTLVTVVHTLGISLLLVIALWTVAEAVREGEIFAASRWLHIDSLSGLFLSLLGVIGFITGLYSIGYMRHEVDHGEISVPTLCYYYGFFHLFLFTMLLVVTSNNLIVMWAAIEATTLSSAFLVGIYGQRSSLEAAWKYIIICTVGVAFGLFGTVLVYANAASFMAQPDHAIFWTEVLKESSQLDPTLMVLAFVFVLIGFGTKTGLFPMHAWLPDAHSEAPSPVSALLSAVLLNCALLVLIRYYIIICHAIGDSFPNRLLLIFGLLSVGVAAFFILVQQDMKRLLAYSSVENMGLVAVALGIGGPLGILAALLHTLNHSLAKTLLFCGSGNVLLKYGTRNMDVVCGMLKVMPFSAVLLGGGALALGGMPPFNIFLSEFMTVTAGLAAEHLAVTILLLVLLTLVLGGLVRMVAKVLFATPPQQVAPGELSWLTTAPMVLLLVMMLVMGTHIPQPVSRLLASAATIVQQNNDDHPTQLSWLWANFDTTAASATPSHRQGE
ncbi:hydrogenase 4 subunit F [Kosakonia pseudosacchari]|uniref:hydrogenase 4 subunit F n=1 Tax=Kosakonia pseudosacchari TaxID=1646340 RepID=UPI0022F1285E|nr:hydrogenase 4 subunit F [Kosakonia pseudosacchari]WBU50615.1 hydrogenase 4 subunit F [Kosakonia pseudosacchari]